MTPEQTQRWQEYGRAHAALAWNVDAYFVKLLRAESPSRQAFYVAMTAYRKELARKQAERPT